MPAAEAPQAVVHVVSGKHGVTRSLELALHRPPALINRAECKCNRTTLCNMLVIHASAVSVQPQISGHKAVRRRPEHQCASVEWNAMHFDELEMNEKQISKERGKTSTACHCRIDNDPADRLPGPCQCFRFFPGPLYVGPRATKKLSQHQLVRTCIAKYMCAECCETRAQPIVANLSNCVDANRLMHGIRNEQTSKRNRWPCQT